MFVALISNSDSFIIAGNKPPMHVFQITTGEAVDEPRNLEDHWLMPACVDRCQETIPLIPELSAISSTSAVTDDKHRRQLQHRR